MITDDPARRIGDREASPVHRCAAPTRASWRSPDRRRKTIACRTVRSADGGELTLARQVVLGMSSSLEVRVFYPT